MTSLPTCLLLRQNVLGDGPDGQRGREHPPSSSGSLQRRHQLQTLHLEWQRWIQESLEQPGVLQGPVVPGDR